MPKKLVFGVYIGMGVVRPETKEVWFMANIPRLTPVLMHDAMQSA